jgi:hypothetical protein
MFIVLSFFYLTYLVLIGEAILFMPGFFGIFAIAWGAITLWMIQSPLWTTKFISMNQLFANINKVRELGPVQTNNPSGASPISIDTLDIH